MAATKKIPKDVLGVLASMDVERRLPNAKIVACITDGQLPRDLYVDVDKVLKALGGKWDRSAKGHVFLDDPSDAIDACVLTGEYTDKKQALQFFETPEALADELVAAAEIKNEHRVLEPSAGRGRIVRAIKYAAPECTLHTVEIDADNYMRLNSIAIWQTSFHADFMKWESSFPFDRCVMNPPFSKRQDVDHVTRAYSMLKPGGRLVSVVSGSAMHRIDKKGEEFRRLVKSRGGSYDLPEGAFKESGTNVRASVVILNKE